MCNAPPSGAPLGETIVAAKRRRRIGATAQHRRLTRSRKRHWSRLEQDDARLRALHAVALMRREERSLHRAAARVGTTPRTVRKYARQALRKQQGSYQVIPLDELRRPMRVLTPRGLAVLDIRSSKTASRLAHYWHGVDMYLRSGDRQLLAPFVGQRFRAEGQLVAFITDPPLLDRLANAGQVTFEELYQTTA